MGVRIALLNCLRSSALCRTEKHLCDMHAALRQHSQPITALYLRLYSIQPLNAASQLVPRHPYSSSTLPIVIEYYKHKVEANPLY